MIKNTLMFLLYLLIIVVIGCSCLHAGSIKYSKHNLSSSNQSGDINSLDTSEICIFCHTSHIIDKTIVPLWNHAEGAPVYTLYNSSTLQSTPGQPDGASKLCLSCHDGTIAMGNTISRQIDFSLLNTNGGLLPSNRSSYLGSDLSNDHPISFDSTAAVNASAELLHPTSGDPVAYEKDGKIQCTTCHNPHNDQYPDFLVKSNRGADICKTCHRPTDYTGLSIHDIVGNSWNGQDLDPWPHSDFTTVADNSCLNCHRGHGSTGKERLLNKMEEDGCLVCHNGTVGENIKSLLSKTSTHRVNFYQGIHDPTENIVTHSLHVECVDCHNPHRVKNASAVAPHVKGSLAGVSGMNISGGIINNASYEYEVCLKCHGQDKYRVTTTIRRMFDTTNIRIAINPTNESYHALAAQGKSDLVPSLIPPYTTLSRLYCVDCHNNNAARSAGGSEPNGPHGSNYEYLLERRYDTMDYTPWTTAAYALCFKCHNPNSLLNNGISRFSKHRLHIQNEQTPCSVCHDPHGSTMYSGLLNFDTNVVFPNQTGKLTFEIFGGRGQCYLLCHEKDHNPKGYQRN